MAVGVLQAVAGEVAVAGDGGGQVGMGRVGAGVEHADADALAHDGPALDLEAQASWAWVSCSASDSSGAAAERGAGRWRRSWPACAHVRALGAGTLWSATTLRTLPSLSRACSVDCETVAATAEK